LSFVNGALVLGIIFGRIYWLLPGRSGVAKGFVFGVLGWIAMGLLFFPLLGRGPFAVRAGLGLLPAIFSLPMILTYSIVMGIAYSALGPVHSGRRDDSDHARMPGGELSEGGGSQQRGASRRGRSVSG
jgi:hypothetical protein